MVKFLANLEKQSRLFQIALILTLLVLIAMLYFLTGYELSFSLFYVLPISLATWLTGKKQGIILSFVSALIWFGVDVIAGNSYSHPFFPFWNTCIRLSFFSIIVFLLSSLKSAMEWEKKLARTDYLTGAVNSPFFIDLIEIEINRLQRYEHPFSLVYIDIDNFKDINDQFGHLTGDKVLYTVVNYVKNNLRKTDVIARLGGDEFGLLLPETNQKAARIILAKIQNALREEMQQNNWPITFSIGVLTCNATPSNIEELLQIADDLMYSVKRSSKNAIKYSSYD